MADILKMPESFSCEGVEGEDAIAEEIVADAVDTDHVGARGAKSDVGDAAGFVEREAAPAVGAGAGAFPTIGAKLFAARDGVETPERFACADIEAKDVAIEAGGDEDMFEDDAGGGGAGGDGDATGGAKDVEGRAGFGVERIKPIAGTDQQAGGIFGIAGPVEQAAAGWDVLEAVGVVALNHRAAPKLGTGGGVEGDEGFAGGGCEEDPVDDDGRALYVCRSVAGAERPCDGEFADVGTGDLRERGVAAGAVVALGAGPAGKRGEGERGSRREVSGFGGRDELEFRESGTGGGVLDGVGGGRGYEARCSEGQ